MYVRSVVVGVVDATALADLPPGPELATALARIDPTRVPNNDLLELRAAQSRQAAHEAARLLGVIAEIGRANPTFDDDTVDRLDHPVPHAADEVRAALAWSRRAADRECDLAEQLVHHLPLVHAAFLAGEIDRAKVRVFADHLTGLTDTQIATVCAALLPRAARLTRPCRSRPRRRRRPTPRAVALRDHQPGRATAVRRHHPSPPHRPCHHRSPRRNRRAAHSRHTPRRADRRRLCGQALGRGPL